ncbi:MAG: heme-copper oxidase subunit III [Verrucomicrobia bacterium]|nr:heme-copper oxidase subunit III [Verrucomicrobiota bacterium]
MAFMATVVMLFAGFTTALLIRRSGSDWAPVELPKLIWVNTGMLIAASALLELACRRRSRSVLGAALAVGVLFLAGQIVVWNQLSAAGHGLGANAHGAFFYVFSAIHGLHLLGGLGAALYVLMRGRNWRATAVYWHFLALMWLYVLYLLHAA